MSVVYTSWNKLPRSVTSNLYKTMHPKSMFYTAIVTIVMTLVCGTKLLITKYNTILT